MRAIRIHDVEVGQCYRFTFSRPILAGSRRRVFEAVVGASFWGEVPLFIAGGTIRVQRDLVTRVQAIY